MDEQNQIQNPNTFSPPTGQSQPVMHKDHHWMLVGVVMFMLALFVVVWGYVVQMNVEPVVQQPVLNTPAREDAEINKEIQDTDLGDVDNEFQAVDADINSL